MGRRKEALEHLTAANENGFSPLTTGCQLIIGDGLKGTDDVEVPVNGEKFSNGIHRTGYHGCRYLHFPDPFQGHELTGFGGAIKNIGMGCGSRAGKWPCTATANPPWMRKSAGAAALYPLLCAGSH
ncbi:MAG: DUF362 domain-containing protein [Bilophila wadsworthia]